MKKINVPECHGRQMNVVMDLGKFWEAHCSVCGEVIYIRKFEVPKPRLIND